MLVEKTIGDEVTGSTINKSGYFIFRATKIGEDTTLSKIIQLVEEASSSKAPIAKLADKISRVFVPVVILISVLSTIIWILLGQDLDFAFSIGISVLVISCPCALGLATPTAIMVGMGKGAENGILIKSAESLEITHSVHTVILDKTGTITEGRPSVTDVIVNGDFTENQLIQIASSIEKKSEHPLATAIVNEGHVREIELLEIKDFNSVQGKGIEANIDSEKYFAGNQKLMEDKNIDISTVVKKAEELAENGKTPLFFAKENILIGIIAVADTIKPTSLQAIKEFEKIGIEVIMMTGDNEKTAKYIADKVGVKNFIAGVLPQDKEKEVRRIQDLGKKVAMIGDGINDAPALARADVGIAIGAGTDVAVESADIVLIKSDLLDAVSAVELSKATIKNIKQNLFWALIYNVIGIPLAAGVFYGALGWQLNPMFGAAAMSMSSVCVVLNALRLKGFKASFRNKSSK